MQNSGDNGPPNGHCFFMPTLADALESTINPILHLRGRGVLLNRPLNVLSLNAVEYSS